MIFSCSQVYSMDPNGFTGRPGTGRVSREAFATMTQVHLSFKTCICLCIGLFIANMTQVLLSLKTCVCLCLGLFICKYDPGSLVFVILNLYLSSSGSLYLQTFFLSAQFANMTWVFFVFLVATLTWVLLSKIFCSSDLDLGIF